MDYAPAALIHPTPSRERGWDRLQGRIPPSADARSVTHLRRHSALRGHAAERMAEQAGTGAFRLPPFDGGLRACGANPPYPIFDKIRPALLIFDRLRGGKPRDC
jgi:hypothetical protein